MCSTGCREATANGGGLTGEGNGYFHQDIGDSRDNDKERAEPFDYFGFELAIGNFNGNKSATKGGELEDLVVGVPFEDVAGQVDAGGFHVIYGVDERGAQWTGDQVWHQNRNAWHQEQPTVIEEAPSRNNPKQTTGSRIIWPRVTSTGMERPTLPRGFPGKYTGAPRVARTSFTVFHSMACSRRVMKSFGKACLLNPFKTLMIRATTDGRICMTSRKPWTNSWAFMPREMTLRITLAPAKSG